MTAFVIHTGDLLELDVDAIVNPANITLQGRGGLSGHILRRGGPRLLAACKAQGLCPPGKAVITPGFDLPQAHVIHAVGPEWRGGARHEADTLAACYQAILALAQAHQLTRIGLPAISTGIFGYPLAQATEIAVREVVNGAAGAGLTEVHFACWDAEAADVYTRLLSRHLTPSP